MNNKVLISVEVPSLETSYDIFIPVNRRVHNVIELIKKVCFDLSLREFEMEKQYALYDAVTGNIYDMNALIRNTDIRNGSKVILI